MCVREQSSLDVDLAGRPQLLTLDTKVGSGEFVEKMTYPFLSIANYRDNNFNVIMLPCLTPVRWTVKGTLTPL